MPLSGASRWFLTAAIVHLAISGALLSFESETAALAQRWDLLVWLLLVGFVAFSTLGFSLHLFPAVARRPRPRGRPERLAFLLAEAGVAVGAVALATPASGGALGGVFTLGSVLVLLAVGVAVVLFLRSVLEPQLRSAGPEARPGDAITVPLFLVAWAAALGALVLFALAGLGKGPGFGWWLAAVHLFVLGHATVLIVAVSLRLVPRSLDADPSRAAAVALAALSSTGAALVPAGMLVFGPAAPDALTISAAPEAAFALGFFALLVQLGVRARTPRRQLGLHLTGIGALLVGGGLGLWMVTTEDFGPVTAHALVNVLGFVGLTILIMWFGMIAPFQRISHAWTRRMLWTLAGVWLLGVVGLAAAAVGGSPVSQVGPELGGALLLGAALAWGVGTIPVLYPVLNPLPGFSGERIRTIRNRWSGR